MLNALGMIKFGDSRGCFILFQFSTTRLMDQQQQMNSGLTRYRSAPSSCFTDLMDFSGYGGGEDCDQFFKASSPDSDRFFSRFMSSCGAEESNPPNSCEIGRNPLVNEPVQSQFVPPMKHEPDVINPQQQQQMVYTSQLQLDHQPVVPKLGVENSYNVASSMKMEGGSNSNLIRHSSSPAGLFAQINADNAGYGVMRGMGNFGTVSVANAEASFSSAGRLKNQMDFPPGPPSSSGIMPRASEIVGSLESGSFGDSSRNDGSYMAGAGGFPSTSWDDSDNFLKGLAENDRKTFSNLNSLEQQTGEGGTGTPTVLAHHLSLPTSSAELSTMEKLLQFQDSVPLSIRAKRGCATHPRSIAERVRRTRISERIRKLQELVPNMDKQTNTADMLDLAADYIKGLQKRAKTLSDNRAKCTCSDNQQK